MVPPPSLIPPIRIVFGIGGPLGSFGFGTIIVVMYGLKSL
jgi:hypothetical protein